ncbi:phosphonate metabolism protein, partial [Methylobacterium sp. WL116]
RETWRARLAAACPPTSLTIDAITLLRQDGAAPFRLLRRIPFAA